MIPHNLKAEQAVLGSIIEDPNCIFGISSDLLPSHFYDKSNAGIYEAMVSLVNRHVPVDLVTLISELEGKERLDSVGGKEYIESLRANGDNLHHYANLVKQMSVKRKLAESGAEIIRFAQDSTIDADTSLAKAQSSLLKVGTTRSIGFETTNEIGLRTEDRIMRKFEHPDECWGLATGIRALDRALSGLERQDNIIVAGRPGCGKTALADSIAVNIAKTGKRVALFTLEMSAEQRFNRMTCLYGGFDFTEVRTGKRKNDNGTWRRWTDDEQVEFLQKRNHVMDMPIYINEKSSIITTEVAAKVGELSLASPLDLVVVDYLGLMGDSPDSKRYEQVGKISRGLKEVAKSCNVPMMNLAQLNRDCEKRPDKKPELADLRDAGDIEQDADVVILLWRPWMYWKNEAEWRKDFKRDPYPGENVAELNIAKFRNGEPGFVQLAFDAPRMRFLDLERRD